MSTAPKSPEPRELSLEDLARAQGVTLPQDIDRLLGQGADLFDDDVEFERYLEWLRQTRRET
jgi:hypothetical protein